MTTATVIQSDDMSKARKEKAIELAGKLKTAQGKDYEKLVQGIPIDDFFDAYTMLREGVATDEQKAKFKDILKRLVPWTIGAVVAVAMFVSGWFIANPTPETPHDPTPAPQPAPPQPGIKKQAMIPEKIDGKVGEPGYLVVPKSVGTKRWVIPPGTPAFVKEYDTELVFVPKTNATDFYLGVVSNKSGMPIEWCLVDMKKPTPTPIPPGPTPPNPPNPNPPTPPTPTPDNILTAQLQAAYAKDKDTDKAVSVAKLAAIYRSAAKVTATDTAFKTVKDIDAAVRIASQGQIGVLAIPNTRDAVGVWLSSQLPTAMATQLDDALRQRYIVAWNAVAASLESLK